MAGYANFVDDGLVGDYEGMWTVELEDIAMEKVIGKGAFGEVYLGNYLGTPVAVKKISAQNEEDELYLQREVTVLK
jgi:predicted Ser/Thr protein kinase